MKKNLFSLHLLAAACLLAGVPQARAGQPGSTALNFLKIEVGAKALGAGGAFSAVADDGTAVYWNPAGLARLRHRQVSVMHISWLEGINYQFVSYIHPLRNGGTLGASLYYLSLSDIPSYDNYGGRLDRELAVSDRAGAISYGRTIGGVDAGITVKHVQETLADESATAFAADAGLLFRVPVADSFFLKRWLKGNLGRELRLAAGIQNIGPEVSFLSTGDPLPMNYRLGIAQDFFHDSLTFSCDANFPGDDAWHLASGLDYRIADWASLRMGYRFKSNRHAHDIQPGLAGGIGLGNEYVSVDYAFVPYSILGATHRVGLNWRFGRVHAEELGEAKIQKHLALARKFRHRKDLVNAYRECGNVLLIDPVNREATGMSKDIQRRIDEIRVEKYLQLAKTLLDQDKLLEAKELLDNVLKLFPEYAGARDYLARIEAVFEEQKAMRAESMFHQGLEFFKHKQYGDALTLWEKVLIVNPAHAQAPEHIARAGEELAKIEEKRRKEEEEQSRKKAEAVYRKAVKLYEDGQWRKAREIFEEARRLRPEHKETGRHLAAINVREAEEYFHKGSKLYDEMKLQEAIKMWEEALRLNANDGKTAGALSKARAELKAANKAGADEYNRRGLKEYDLGNLQNAAELWEEAAKLDPENTKIRNNLNRAREELKKKR